MTTTSNAPATEKQISFLIKLVTERQVLDERMDIAIKQIRCWDEDGALTKSRASKLIDSALAAPRRPQEQERCLCSGVGAAPSIDCPAHSPNKAAKPERKIAEVGYYSKDGEFYAVVKSRGSERRYAKVLVVSEPTEFAVRYNRPEVGPLRKTVRWEYTPGVVASLTEEDKLTLEQAKEFGHLHGHCLVCTRQLTDPQSVEQGVGPVCAKKL